MPLSYLYLFAGLYTANQRLLDIGSPKLGMEEGKYRYISAAAQVQPGFGTRMYKQSLQNNSSPTH